jgi:hypothetical protein
MNTTIGIILIVIGIVFLYKAHDGKNVVPMSAENQAKWDYIAKTSALPKDAVENGDGTYSVISPRGRCVNFEVDGMKGTACSGEDGEGPNGGKGGKVFIKGKQVTP